MKEKVYRDLTKYAEKKMRNSLDIQHDWKHVSRVNRNATEFAKALEIKDIDIRLLSSMCALHDLTYAYYPASFKVFLFEGIYINRILKRDLLQFDLEKEERDLIINACIHHPYSFPFRILNKRHNLYSQILQDSDTIDYFNSKRVKSFIKKNGLPQLFQLIARYIRNNWITFFLNKPEVFNLLAEKKFKRYGIWNKSKSETFVLIPGYAGDAQRFKMLSKIFRNVRIVYINLPMEKGNSKVYNIEELNNYVLNIVKELNLKQFTLLGFSLGGLISLDLMKSNESLVKKTYLLNSFPNLINNNNLKNFIKIIKPILLSKLFLKIYAVINTTDLIRRVLKRELLNKNVYRKMRNNYYSLFGTLFSCVDYEGYNIYKKYKDKIRIVLFKDDDIVKYDVYSKVARALTIPILSAESGSHCEKSCYWNSLAQIFKTEEIGLELDDSILNLGEDNVLLNYAFTSHNDSLRK